MEEAHRSLAMVVAWLCYRWQRREGRFCRICYRYSYNWCFSPTFMSVLSNLFYPAGRTRHNIIMKPRAAPVNSKVTTKICWTLKYCICVIVIFWNQRLSITYAHAAFDKFHPFSVTNLWRPPFMYVTFSTYKLAIAQYNLNFKLMYNHLFIPLWFF